MSARSVCYRLLPSSEGRSRHFVWPRGISRSVREQLSCQAWLHLRGPKGSSCSSEGRFEQSLAEESGKDQLGWTGQKRPPSPQASAQDAKGVRRLPRQHRDSAKPTAMGDGRIQIAGSTVCSCASVRRIGLECTYLAKAKQVQKQRRDVHRTQWTAQFAVASELCKRGYLVAFTMGSHPVIDLMVISPKGAPFLVDVKGQYKHNFWPVQPKKTCERLFYVFALVPDDEQNKFFVLTQKEVEKGIRVDLEHARARRKAKGPPPSDQRCAPCLRLQTMPAE